MFFNTPRRYIDKRRDKINHIKIKTSLFKNPHPETRSAFDKNFNASASSIKPNVILNFFIQVPDFGRFLIKFGKRANIAKGSANEIPKPSIPAVNWYAPPLIDNDPTNKEPSIGPVHEKETSAKVKDMKKMPIIPDIEDLDSVLFKKNTGRVNS